MENLDLQIKKGGVYTTIENITPKQAELLLKRNLKNRSVKKHKVHMYAHDMKRGSWLLTGESLKLSKFGELIDGQNRLLACIEAGVPFQTFITYNLDPDVKNICDTGTARTAGDVMSINEIKNANRIAASLVNFIALKNKGRVAKTDKTKFKNSNIDILNLYYKYKIVIDMYYPLADRFYIKSRLLTGSYILGVMLYLAIEKNHSKSKIESFFSQLLTGMNVENNTINILRDKLILHLASHRNKLTPAVKQALIAKTWNLYLSNKERLVLRFDPNLDNYIDFN